MNLGGVSNDAHRGVVLLRRFKRVKLLSLARLTPERLGVNSKDT